jgi:cysteinyl-tRNA synthetase, unknown class
MKNLLAVILFLAGGHSVLSEQIPGSFAYLLQADAFAKSKTEAVARLAACGRDWIVLDANFRSGEPWTAADLTSIRAGRAGRKAMAYLSIGEAGDYRAYWRPEWDAGRDGSPDAAAPAWLLAQNPEWKNNYRVKYWQAEWQKIILADADKIMAAGFDGVYLDIVDGFETFEREGENFLDDRMNPETKQSYRRDMMDWVKSVAARVRKANPTAFIIPQNGTQLLAHPDFLSVVDAVGVEDLFTHGDKLKKAADTNYILKNLALALAAHKPVLDIEYPQGKDLQMRVKEQAAQHGLVCLVTDRQLKTIGESGK